MKCPRCGGEFQDWVIQCPDCEVPLVAGEVHHRPVPGFEGPERGAESHEGMVTVAHLSPSPSELSAVRMLLTSSGIPFFIENDRPQDELGLGRLGVNSASGPVVLKVPAGYESEVQALLEEPKPRTFENDAGGPVHSETQMVEDGKPVKPKGGASFARGVFAGLLLGAIGHYFLVSDFAGLALPWASEEKLPDGEHEVDVDEDGVVDLIHKVEGGQIVATRADRNSDGKMDLWSTYRENMQGATRSDNDFDGKVDSWYRSDGFTPVDSGSYEEDRNGDGKADSWRFFHRGILTRQSDDKNFDGEPDRWTDFRNRYAYEVACDLDFDGVVDAKTRFSRGLPQLEIVQPGGSDAVLGRRIYQHGVLREELWDTDGDGRLDQRLIYDEFGRRVSAAEIPNG